MKGKKLCFGLLLVFCTIFGALFVGSSDTSAASLQTSIYNVWYRRYSNESFTRLSDISTGYSNGFNATALRWYEFKSVPVTTTGQYASLHFETNIVYSRGANQQGGIGEYNFVNGTYMNTMRCWLGSTRLRIISQSLSFSSTPWRGTSPGGIPIENITRTWYGDVSLADIPLNVTDSIICEIGSDQFNMFDTTVDQPNLLYTPWLWFEQNPADITFTYSATESQLGGLSEQQQIIIQQNEQTYDWLTDNTPPDVDTSSLGNSAGWLPAGPVDSILTLPITLAQGILGVFTGTHTCSPIVLPFSLGPYDESLTIPCMDEYFRLSEISILWNAVGAIISGIIIYNTLKWLYKFVDDTLTLRENDSTLWGGL